MAMIRRRAKIIVELNRLNEQRIKYFVGTEDEVFIEACDWMHEVALKFIAENGITDEWECEKVMAGASHTIVWEDEVLVMYAVCESDCIEPVHGIFLNREDAEEYILSDAEEWAYRVLMTEDPMDVFGAHEYDWVEDYQYLLREAGRALYIQEVPVFDVEVK